MRKIGVDHNSKGGVELGLKACTCGFDLRFKARVS